MIFQIYLVNVKMKQQYKLEPDEELRIEDCFLSIYIKLLTDIEYVDIKTGWKLSSS